MNTKSLRVLVAKQVEKYCPLFIFKNESFVPFTSDLKPQAETIYIGLFNKKHYVIDPQKIPNPDKVQNIDNDLFWVDFVGLSEFDLEHWETIGSILLLENVNIIPTIRASLANGLLEVYAANNLKVTNVEFKSIIERFITTSPLLWAFVDPFVQSIRTSSSTMTLDQYKDLSVLLQAQVKTRKILTQPHCSIGQSSWLLDTENNHVLGCRSYNYHPDIKVKVPKEDPSYDWSKNKEIRKRITLNCPTHEVSLTVNAPKQNKLFRHQTIEEATEVNDILNSGLQESQLVDDILNQQEGYKDSNDYNQDSDPLD